MDSMKALLEQALGDDEFTAGAAVDPGGDLTRARAHLRRRRVGMAAAVAVTVVVAGLAPVALIGRGGPSSVNQVTAPIALVSYTGRQPRGYTVAWIPRGWQIEGGDLDYLTIAPPGRDLAQELADGQPDRRMSAREQAQRKKVSGSPLERVEGDPTAFEGKLVVMSASAGAEHSGVLVQVAGQPGYLRAGEHTQILTYRSSRGLWVVIQAPDLLGWDDARIVQFAAGVTVSAKAVRGGAG